MSHHDPDVEVISDTRCSVGESPVWDRRADALLWVDIVGRRLLRKRLGAGGETERWTFNDLVCAVAERRHAPGLILAQRHAFTLFDPDSGAREPLVDFAHVGERVRANDGRCDPAGRFWVGTMQNNIATDGSPLDLTERAGTLFSLDGEGGPLTPHVHGIGIPNGLCWSPDGRTLYLADTLDERIDAFDVDPDDGTLSGRRTLVEPGDPGGPDGAAVDVDGCLWVARWGGARVVRYTPAGRLDRVVEVPVANPSACAFGGPGNRTLFITSATFGLAPEDEHPSGLDGAVLAVDVGVEGIPAHAFAW